MSVDSFSQNAKSLTRVSSLTSGNIYNYKFIKKVTRNGKNKNIAQQVREKLFPTVNFQSLNSSLGSRTGMGETSY